jgi:hypothetical protein
MTKEMFDKEIAALGDIDFKNWVAEKCVWVETTTEKMYYFLPMNWKFHSCYTLHRYYQAHYETNAKAIKHQSK